MEEGTIPFSFRLFSRGGYKKHTHTRGSTGWPKSRSGFRCFGRLALLYWEYCTGWWMWLVLAKSSQCKFFLTTINVFYVDFDAQFSPFSGPRHPHSQTLFFFSVDLKFTFLKVPCHHSCTLTTFWPISIFVSFTVALTSQNTEIRTDFSATPWTP